MDNFHFDVSSCAEDHLSLALELAFSGDCQRMAIGYVRKEIKGIDTLVLLSYNKYPNSIPFPAPLDVYDSTIIVRSFLKNTKSQEQPDHDGYNKLGFRVFNNEWAKVDGIDGSICGIQPAWLVYSK